MKKLFNTFFRVFVENEDFSFFVSYDVTDPGCYGNLYFLFLMQIWAAGEVRRTKCAQHLRRTNWHLYEADLLQMLDWVRPARIRRKAVEWNVQVKFR